MNENPTVSDAEAALRERVDDGDVEGIVRISSNESVHSGVPYLHVEIRMNEYGEIATADGASDPIGTVLHEFGLVNAQLLPATKTTDRVGMWFCAADDILEMGDDGLEWD